MTDDEILELVRLSKAYIGQERIWLAYAGDRTPVRCFSCGVSVGHNESDTKAKIGQVWTNYSDRWGQKCRVWFPKERWDSMELVVAKDAA